MEKEKEVRREPVTTIPIPCFQRRTRCKGHEGGNYHTLVTGVQIMPVNLGLVHKML